MPWPAYRNATDEDLRSVYAYLRTIKPIVNHVPECNRRSTNFPANDRPTTIFPPHPNATAGWSRHFRGALSLMRASSLDLSPWRRAHANVCFASACFRVSTAAPQNIVVSPSGSGDLFDTGAAVVCTGEAPAGSAGEANNRRRRESDRGQNAGADLLREDQDNME